MQSPPELIVETLNVCCDEIAVALHASDKSVIQLAENFVTVARLVDELVEELGPNYIYIDSNGAGDRIIKIREAMNESVQSLQFYDRLTQQLNHVSMLLKGLIVASDGEASVEARRWHDTMSTNDIENNSVELF